MVDTGSHNDSRKDRDKRHTIPLTQEEKTLLERAAGLAGLPVAQWARMLLLPAARRQIADGEPKEAA